MAIEAIGNVYQFTDENGVPYAGGSLTFVIVSTSTAQAVYSDPALTVSIGNVITLNAAGRTSTGSTGPDTPIYFQQKTYDYTLKNASGTTIYGPITFSGSQWPGQVQGQAILSPAANANGYTNRFTTTINKASSGTHALFAGTRFDIPTIGSGASTLTEAATVYIEGAPATGTNQYALDIAAGVARFGGGISVNLTNHGVVIGQGTAALVATTPGTAGQVLTSNGASADPSFQSLGIIDRQVTTQTVNNSSAETAVYTYSVPGGTLSTNKVLHLSLIGDMLNNSGGGITVTVRVKYGGTTFFSCAFTNVNNGTSVGYLNLEAEMVAGNATNAQRAKTLCWVDPLNEATVGGTAISKDFVGGAGGTPVLAGGTFSMCNHVAMAVDSTAAQNLVVTFQMSTANNAATLHCYTAYTEIK